MIEQLGKGLWKVTIYREVNPATGRYPRRSVRVHGPKSEAQKIEVELLRMRDSGLSFDATKMTVSEYLNQWFTSTMSSRADKTNDTYESLIRCHIIPSVGRFQLGKLQPLQVQQMYEALGSTLSPRSVIDIHRLLSRALKQAVTWRFIERNTCASVVPPTAKRPLIVTLTRDETRRLIQVAAATSQGVLVHLAVTTGMRRGELLGLRWQDVDLDGGIIRIQQTAQWIDGKGMVLKGPKTDASRRSVLLTADIIDALRRHRTRQLAGRLKARGAYEDLDLVFASAVGTAVNPTTLRRVWERVLQEAGLTAVGGRPFRFHDLRHSHATQLLEQRVPTKVVSERLGHTTTAITRELYQHVTATMQVQAVRDYGNWLAGRSGKRASGEARTLPT